MCVDCQKTFDNEAKSYDDTSFVIPHYYEILDEMLSKSDFPEDSEIKVLDLGCGTGNLSLAVLQKYPRAQIYAVDFSEEMLLVAEQKLKSKGVVNFILGDIFELDSTALPYFDLVISSFVLHNYEEIKLYEVIFKKSIDFLSVDGRLILGDLVKCEPKKLAHEQEKLKEIMRLNGLTDANISTWFKVFQDEDFPLPIEKTIELLNNAGFDSVNLKCFGCTAVFSAIKPLDVLQVKCELLVRGLRNSCELKTIYEKQNPNKVTKTGNNGVFLTLNNTYHVLASFLHENNSHSPYKLTKRQNSDSLQLLKNGHNLDIEIASMNMPSWYSTPINDTMNFPSYFVLEGDKYLHLAYKSCSFSELQRCRFCSVQTRDAIEFEDNVDPSANEICVALEKMISEHHIPEEFHFCLGGGTYLPLSKNVDFYCQIIGFIRSRGVTNPIWVEMIPPSRVDLQRLIGAGATSFGFNIEVLDEEKRQEYCPGKSQIAPISHYEEAFEYACNLIGNEKLGSCIIVGLDSLDKLTKSVDYLINLGGIFPCVLPLKEFDGMSMHLSIHSRTLLERHFMLVSQYAADQIIKNHIEIQNNEGCMNCTCCTIIHDLIKKWRYYS